MQALHYLFLLVCTLFQLTYSSQDPFHYRGLGYLHQAEEISDCIVVTSSFPASASCLSPETGEPKWQITFRKDAFVVSFKAFERLSVFLVQSEGGRSFLYALLNRAGALLWELDLPLKSQLKATTLSFDSAINEISLITDGGVVVIGNALSTTPELHSTALNLDSCHVYPHSSTSTNRILGGCVSLKTGESSQIIFLGESKHLQLKPTEVTIPVITASILGNSVRAELKLDGKLKGSSSIDLSRFSTTQDANYEILTSDFFYNTEQDAKLIPTLYLMIRLLNPSKLLHIVVQSFKHDTKHELIDVVLEGEMKLVKSTHANLINAYNDFYFVQFQPTIAAHEKKEELRVTGQHVNDRITLFTLTLPRPLFSSLDSLSRIISLTPSNRRHVLLTLKSGVVLDINLNNEGRRHSSTVNWIRNDGLSHLQQPQVLHSSIHEQSSASEADQSSFVNKLSFQNIIQLFSTSSQYANCDLSRSVLAISRDEREKSFVKTGLAVHLVAIKPKFCGNVRIDTWYPILPTSVANDIVVESVQVVPLWDSSSAHTSASLIASGFDLIVSAPSGRTFVWHHKFSNVHGQFYWASASYDNHFQSLYPSSEFNVGKALLTPLSFNNFVGLLVGDSNHHEVITYQKSSLPNNQNYFFSVNRTSGSVMVEKLTSAECQSEDQTKCFVPVAVANINFDSTLEEIVLILRPNGHHAFNNRATTLGDDNILLNYINPNLAVVCTKSSTNAEKDESDSTLFINIIDVVSGKILHRVSHENVESPIRGVIIENFVLVSYWNGKAKRGEVSSIGLYDGFIGKSDFTPFGTESKAAKAEDHPNFYKVGNITRKSSFHTSAPLVMQRTYAFTRGIADLTQSISSRGINNKNLLIAFDSGQISSIDFRALSPRRPLSDPTQSEREEGLIKYNPFITIMPTSILTKSKYLTFSNSLRLLSTSAHLESESFVIAIGENGDLFVDVFTPAQPFDSLSSDFNHLALCALLVGLLVAVLLLRHFNRKSTLSRLWH